MLSAETSKISGLALFSGSVSNHLGSALEWHSRGQRFDPAMLHYYKAWKHYVSKPFYFFENRVFGACNSLGFHFFYRLRYLHQNDDGNYNDGSFLLFFCFGILGTSIS